jgi:hypothetical protein
VKSYDPTTDREWVLLAIERARFWQYPLDSEWAVEIGTGPHERIVTHKAGTYQVIRYVSLIESLMEEAAERRSTAS